MRGIVAVAVLAALLAQAGFVAVANAGHGGGEILRSGGAERAHGHGGGEVL